jgi:flagellar biosynthetic protein FliQ
MDPSHLIEQSQQALMLAITILLPVLGIAAVVGLVVAVLQSATQVQDPTIAHLPRLLAVVAALVLLGPWMGHAIASFAEHAFLAAAAR